MDSLVLGIMAIKKRNFLQRSKSGIKTGSENSLQPSIKLDYSDTYRENDALEGNLEEHLDGLKRMEKRQLLEKGEQLKEIRKQVEVITRLQEAVNSRKPGQSAGLVSSRSSRASIQYGRSNSRRKSRANMADDIQDVSIPDVDFVALSQATKSQMRVAAEREKYSAKNLFNVRRPKTALGNYSANEKHSASQVRFFAGPSNNDISNLTSDNGRSERAEDKDTSLIDAHKNSAGFKQRPASATNIHLHNGLSADGENENKNNDIFFHKTNSHEREAQKKMHTKGYLRPTTASRGGGPLNANSDHNTLAGNNDITARPVRPKTAVGFAHHHEDEVDDLLPPRPKSAVMRSRSRRQLELLCRAMEPEVEEAAAAAAAIVSGDAKEWEIINEKRRRRKLNELRKEGQELDIRVQRFLTDIDGFNKRRSSVKRRPSSAGFALHATRFDEDF
ncbi:hypothetical protein PoB_005986500 [Plakobranchus ocellatus]|uniref:Uncharacterized protein n=1 Tax=Plakobranchus ocellatus TaxID=259542 RepID=A0AAV4CMZ7_9GAST|nr:hypothetical protein PoB_005986500 [Plakobranchus ocellatus]